MSIVVVGNVFMDIKGFPSGRYIPDGRNAGDVIFVHGGVGRNVAEDIANVELRPVFVSMVDDTAEGAEVLRKLQNHKVNTDYVLSVPDGMGLWLAIFDETGDVAGSISKRPEMSAMVRLLEEKGDEIFREADSVIVEIDMDKDIIKSVFKYAQKYRKRVYAVVANMSIATQRRDFLRCVDCFICNAEEAGLLFVRDYSAFSPEELSFELQRCIVSAGIPSMVVTLGDKGCVYADIHGCRGFYPAQSVHVMDTTGAGDAFCAGVSIALTYGKTLPQAAAVGTRLAGSVVSVAENVCPRFLPEELDIDTRQLEENSK